MKIIKNTLIAVGCVAIVGGLLGAGTSVMSVSVDKATHVLIEPTAQQLVAANPLLGGGGTSLTADQIVALVQNNRLFPIFVLTMPPDCTDFELKCSLDGFQTLCYWHASAFDTTQDRSESFWDANIKIYYTLNNSSEPRKWHLANNNLSLAEQVGSGATIYQIIVIPSKITGSNNWMFQANMNAQWVVLPFTTFGPLKDDNGKEAWYPTRANEWMLTQSFSTP